MGGIILALSILSVILSIGLFSYRRQIKKICRQLAFIREHSSNMLLTQDIHSSVITDLVNEMNSVLEDKKRQSIQYQKKDADLKEIITHLSHDIRTPLTSLDGYFQLLSEGGIKERERYIAIIQERIKSLKEMLDELFTYAKLQNDGYQLECMPVNMNKILCDTAFSFYEDFKKKNMEPVLCITDSPMSVVCNEAALKRVLYNIIKNGMEHGQGQMKIHLEEIADTLVIRFINAYYPSEAFQIEKVFDRFYKADTARSHTSTGLGLFIAKELTEKMGGKIIASYRQNIFQIEIEFRKKNAN